MLVLSLLIINLLAHFRARTFQKKSSGNSTLTRIAGSTRRLMVRLIHFFDLSDNASKTVYQFIQFIHKSILYIHHCETFVKGNVSWDRI